MPPSVGSVETAASGRMPRAARKSRDEILPAQAVTVFFLYRARHEYGYAFRPQAEVGHDFSAVEHGGHAAALIRGSQPSDAVLVFKAGIRIETPVCESPGAYRVDVRVVGEKAGTGAEPAQRIAHAVDFRRVTEFFHFLR